MILSRFCFLAVLCALPGTVVHAQDSAPADAAPAPSMAVPSPTPAPAAPPVPAFPSHVTTIPRVPSTSIPATQVPSAPVVKPTPVPSGPVVDPTPTPGAPITAPVPSQPQSSLSPKPQRTHIGTPVKTSLNGAAPEISATLAPTIVSPTPSTASPTTSSATPEASSDAQKDVSKNVNVAPALSPQEIEARNLSVAQDLVRSFDMKDLMQGALAAMMKGMVPLISQENPGEDDKIEQITSDAMQKVMTAHLAELEKNKALVYSQLFTYAELEQLKKFYGSPVGQKMLKETSEMMHRNAILDQVVMMQTVQEVRKDLLQDLKKNGMKVPKTMGAS